MIVNKNNKSIRKAVPADIDIIHNLLDMDTFKYNDDVPFDREWIEQLVIHKKCLTLVYETEGMIKGFISGERLISGSILLWFCVVKKNTRIILSVQNFIMNLKKNVKTQE